MNKVKPQIFDSLIIGGGPAGLTAALAFARMRSTALVFDSQAYRNEGISHMHTVPSRDHFDPHEFRRISREQITSRYETVWIEQANITHAKQQQLEGKYAGFEVTDEQGNKYAGRKLILATGSRDVLPDIPGYRENWPSHIYQCLVCDGFEQKGTPIGMLEFTTPMMGHMVYMARHFDSRITIFSNGPVSQDEGIQQAWKTSKALGAKLDERKITRLVNNGPTHEEGVTIEFEEGEPVTLGFIGHRPPTVNRAQHLIEQLGIETVPVEQGGHIAIKDMMQQTSVSGVFAAGDTCTMIKQVTVAMGEGLKAAAGASKTLGDERMEEALKALEDEK